MLLTEAVANYFEDANLRDLIDLIQSNVSKSPLHSINLSVSVIFQLFRCCGIKNPGDWESNVYFACDSVAFQRCSVPYSCCDLVSYPLVTY